MTDKTITTHDLYEGIKSLIGKDSAYAVAKYLGAARQSGCNWRDGKQSMDDPFAIKAAKALNLDPDYVLACLAAERAARGHNADSAAAWQRIAIRLSTAASISFLAVLVAIMTKSPII